MDKIFSLPRNLLCVAGTRLSDNYGEGRCYVVGDIACAELRGQILVLDSNKIRDHRLNLQLRAFKPPFCAKFANFALTIRRLGPINLSLRFQYVSYVGEVFCQYIWTNLIQTSSQWIRRFGYNFWDRSIQLKPSLSPLSIFCCRSAPISSLCTGNQFWLM